VNCKAAGASGISNEFFSCYYYYGESILNGDCATRTEGFVYLGLPEFVEAFYSNKMTKCEKDL